ncbi:polysaccharide biosynthesis tyrosine autokinase [Nocardioides caricicola]|uniref:Polysaccharide biosynthesis tyrosine autokinase n=1 Tax=Nocardioides caricicola TaxID=634770 RepID=A0ABW0MUI9_9ACTN
MTFAEYFVLLQRRWRIWVAGLLLGLLAAGVVSALAPTRYTATAQSFVTVAERVDGSGQGEIFQGSQFAVQRVKSYAPLVRSPDVLQPVITRLELDRSVAELGAQVTVSSAPETVLLDVSVTDADPELARQLADAISVRLGLVIEQLETPRDSGVSNVTVSLARPAAVPTEPSSPRVLLNLLLGGVAGLAIGLVLAVLRHYLDKRIKTADDVRALTDMSPLGSTLYQRSVRRRPLVALDWRSAAAERYRTVRTALKFATVDRELRHFAVTSSLAGEGKTSVACNLAISWAQSGASVCLVEADLRRPAVARFLGLDGSVGLSDVLVGERDLDQVLVPWNHHMLTVLPAGSLPPDPAALLGSAPMASLAGILRDRFDVVIYDTPPLLSVTDAVVLGRHVDGVVLVIRSSVTRRDQVIQCLETLRRSRLALLGSVVTNERRRRREVEHDYTSDLGNDRVELAPLTSEAPVEPAVETLVEPVVVEADRAGKGSGFWLGDGHGRLVLPSAGSASVSASARGCWPTRTGISPTSACVSTGGSCCCGA